MGQLPPQLSRRAGRLARSAGASFARAITIVRKAVPPWLFRERFSRLAAVTSIARSRSGHHRDVLRAGGDLRAADRSPGSTQVSLQISSHRHPPRTGSGRTRAVRMSIASCLGTRASVVWAFVTGLMVMVIAITIGLVSGYAGGVVDDILSLITNVFW